MIEIDSLEDFDGHLLRVGDLDGVVLQGLDLCERTTSLLTLDLATTTTMRSTMRLANGCRLIIATLE